MKSSAHKYPQVIPGFKVMEWLRQVREEEYKLYQESPEAYFRSIRECEQRIEKRLASHRSKQRATNAGEVGKLHG